MRTKTPFRRKRLISRGSSSSTSVEVKVERELQCSRCKAIFPDYLARCPECGSEEWIGLVEVNPYTRMPMETFLKACGHLLWLVGTSFPRIPSIFSVSTRFLSQPSDMKSKFILFVFPFSV